MQMQKQQGFTLIELVVVIIILGILAVTAAPKFMNLQGDARASAIAGIKGAIQGANTLVYSKAALAGKEQGDTDGAALLDIAGTTDVNIVYGYIAASKADLEAALDVTFDAGAVTDGVATATPIADTTTTADWIIEADTDAGSVEIWQAGAPSTCSFTYKSATAAGNVPDYGTMPNADDC
jgi:MSHA pilin protein MshA